jgi:hypothetical protein
MWLVSARAYFGCPSAASINRAVRDLSLSSSPRQEKSDADRRAAETGCLELKGLFWEICPDGESNALELRYETDTLRRCCYFLRVVWRARSASRIRLS